MSVMALLLVLLLGMVGGATRIWRDGESRADSYREARAALGIMARDFGGLAPTTNAGHFLINSDAFPALSAISNIATNSAVLFLSALPASAQDPSSNRSATCQIGYFLAFGKSSPVSGSQGNSMNIYRYMLSGDPTFFRLADVAMPVFPDDLSTDYDPRVELLARNITGITFRAYSATSDSLAAFSSSAATPVPDLIEICISAISQEAAKKLGSNRDVWENPASPAVQPALQTFTTRIHIGSQQ